jgi:hypothetical protein
MHRLVALLLLIVLSAGTATPARTAESKDSVRVILLFVVKPLDDPSRKGVEAWSQLFEISISSLLADFSGGSDPKTSIEVRVLRENVDAISRDVLEASFGRQPSLQVLKTVGAAGAEATLIVNEIYLGEYKGRLKGAYVYLSRKVIPFDYKITREALAAVTLYAYAMAIAKISPEKARFTVCKVLDRANMYRNSELDPDARNSLEDLFRAISAELEARSCGGKG